MWLLLILVMVYGACVGSFLNVVIYRLPAGESLWRPPSHCPHCQARLAWFDNIPLLAWCYLRGCCRRCRAPISCQYFLVELVAAVLFGGIFAVYYMTRLRPELADAGVTQTWLVLIVHLILIGGLLAATVIDAKLYIIPLEIPFVISSVSVILLPLSHVWCPGSAGILPRLGGFWLAASGGGAIGLIIALLLLWKRWIPRSFDVEHDAAAESADRDVETPEQWLAHPHPRREVLKECLYVGWPFLGALAAGAVVHAMLPGGFQHVPGLLTVAFSVIWGYLVGGGLVWAIRILGTLGFGKEAMGLGDVHLMAAIGAALGWFDAIVIFFLAPFVGLAGTILVAGFGRLLRGQVRVVPYGPYLAGSAVIWMLFRLPLQNLYGILLGTP